MSYKTEQLKRELAESEACDELRKECGKWHVTYAKSNFYCSNSDIFTACIDLIEELVKQGYIKTKKQ